MVSAALDVAKSVTTVNGSPATPATVVTPGAVIAYTILLTNAGPASVTTTLTETIGNNVTYTGTGEGWTCPNGTDPGDQCTRGVTVGAGASTSVTFTVTVDDPLPAAVTTIGNVVTSSVGTCSACQVTNPAATAGITLVKTADPATYAAGDVVTYTFTTTNSGTATLADVEVSDTGLAGLGALDCTPAAPATLAPGAMLVCTATKTMTQADADAGAVTNTATATGTPPGGGAVTDTDDETVTSAATAGITLVKTADPATYAAGDVVTYTFTTTNSGTATLADVEVSDTGLAGLGALDCTPAAPATLAPGAMLVCTATKTMTQADADAGAVTNTATATGTPPGGGAVTDTDDETVTSAATAGITLVKTADPATYAAGDVVTYTFTTTNSGTATLADVEVSDTGLAGLGALDCTPAAPATLAPGDMLVCTATKTMTQADADAGAVTNTATATGTPPGGGAVTDTDDETVTSAATAGITLVKTADPATYAAGDVVTYTFTTTNSGTATLADVEVSDTGLAGLGALDCTPAAPATLAPGAMLVCTATKTMTQADADAGAVTNTATATGTPPGGGAVTDTDDETVISTAVARLSLEKVDVLRDENGNGKADVGEVIEYSFRVTNTGGLTLTEVRVSDPMLGGDVACRPSTLAPGETANCGPVNYTVTQADVERDAIINHASATATNPVPNSPDPKSTDSTATPTSTGTSEVPEPPMTPESPDLPATGASAAMTTNALVGAGLLLAGCLLVGVGRRRRNNP